MFLTNKWNVWSFLWDLCEILHITLPWDIAPWLFGRAISETRYEKVEE